MAYYTPSKLNEYLNCPLKYRFVYVDKLEKKTEGIEAFVGTCVHEALEKMLALEKDYGREPSYKAAERLYFEAWDRLYHPDVVIRRPDLTLEDYKRRGQIMLENYFRIDSEHDFGRVVDLERTLYFQVDGTQFRGKIDRVQRDGDTVHIIDYKTGTRAKSQKEADDDIQLALYELGIRGAYPDARSVELHWFMLGQSEVVTSMSDEEARQRLVERVCSLAAEIESTTDFRPKESALCGWCDYQEECAEEKQRRTLKPEPEQVPPASELADEYAKLSASKTEINARLKQIDERLEALRTLLGSACRKQGAWTVEGSECVLDVTPDVGVYMPDKKAAERAELETLVRQAGIWESVSDINKSLVQKALEQGRFGNLTARVRVLLERREVFKIKVKPRR